jgi:hypothetical protein
MSENRKPIEEFFLVALLRIILLGVGVIMVVDFYLTNYRLSRSLFVDLAVLSAVIISYTVYKLGYFKTSVVLIATIIMVAMFTQAILSDSITTTSMAVVMIIGFGYSLLLTGKLRIVMHVVTMCGMTAVFIWQVLHPKLYGKPDGNDIAVMGITYSILYGIVSYSCRVLKKRYDEIVKDLAVSNTELIKKSSEIEAQNEELIQSQETLYQLNTHLESLVDERTHEVKKQNELLIKYAYSNAHHVRGPVARVLGLIQLSKLENKLDYPFLFEKIEEQTKEIDEVVKSINRELEK